MTGIDAKGAAGTKRPLLGAILRLLTTLARPLIRCGVGFQEFSELAAAAYVKAATEDYGIRKRPANISRVAAVTGISRKAVKKIRSSLKEEPLLVEASPIAPTRLVSLWLSDPDYCEVRGVPLELPFDSDAGPSFSRLARLAGGDLSPSTLRRELMRAGCVGETNDGRLRLEKHFFSRPDLDERLANGLELGTRKHVETVDFNTRPASQDSLRYERFHYVFLPDTHADGQKLTKLMNTYLEQTGVSVAAFLDALSQSTAPNGDRPSTDHPPGSRATAARKSTESERPMLGVGIYLYVDSALQNVDQPRC